ncbi:hypothetical protein VP01_2539g4 [Puccinia sorghi]|uniref:Tc1-like transposase DDE domain-containing protein n=1 Tax=Puccinia sorghi TaxID=27349 RepID=A0A0L6V582_9BASI|nr:hypothetical protein VP01_2539g4 [Puccinia sorghi]
MCFSILLFISILNTLLLLFIAYKNLIPTAKHVQNEFDILVSPGAIQKTLHNIEVTWKTVTPIPHKWNEAAFLQERHEYVLNRVTNIRQKLIFIDDAKLIYFFSIGGFIYFELLNKDGKKKTGTTSIDICNFLVRLQDHCPAESIIIMDNTRIHCGYNFEQVKDLLKESTNKITIEFLPKRNPSSNKQQDDTRNLLRIISTLPEVQLRLYSYAAHYGKHNQGHGKFISGSFQQCLLIFSFSI